MPELPDLRIIADAFTAALSGRSFDGASVKQPLVLRGTGAELRGLEGHLLADVQQRGKFLTLTLGPHRIVINPMLTGRLGLARPGAKALPSTALVLSFGARVRSRAVEPAAWTRGAGWIPRDDESVELRYRDPKKMGKVYILPAHIDREVVGWSELGPDVDDASLDLDTWQGRIKRHNGELQNLLKNQQFVAGIGNAYSDEVLWAARIAPFRKRASLAPEESERLWRASREVMAWAVDELRERVPPTFEKQARDFLRVHLKGGNGVPALWHDPERGVTGWLHHDVVPILSGVGGSSRRGLLDEPEETGHGLELFDAEGARGGHDDDVTGLDERRLVGHAFVGPDDAAAAGSEGLGDLEQRLAFLDLVLDELFGATRLSARRWRASGNGRRRRARRGRWRGLRSGGYYARVGCRGLG